MSAADRIEKLEARVEQLEDLLWQIRTWARAYPLDIAPEPDWKKAQKLLEGGGMTLGSVTCASMRHVIEGVQRIIDGARLDDEKEKDDE